MWRRTTIRPPRTLTSMTGIAASIMRSAGDGERMRVTIRLMMVEETTRRSRLVEEELAKEKGMDHRSRRQEKMGINLLLHPDRRVSLMVIVEVLSALAKRFEKPSRPPPPPIPTFKDSFKEFPRFKADLKAYLKEFYSTASKRVKVMTIHEKCFTKATLAKIELATLTR